MNRADRAAWVTGLEDWKKRLARAMDVADTERDIFVAVVDFEDLQPATVQDIDARHRILRDTIRRLQAHLQSGDFLTWYAGSRTAICLARRSPFEVVELIQKLRSLVVGDLPLRAGIAIWNGFESSEMLVARAEFELLEAKEQGVDGPQMGPWLRSRLRSADDKSH